MPLKERLQNLNLEDKQSLVGFFELLLKIDRRVNPDDYEIAPIDKSRHKVYGENIR
jgi:hypothetical protein